MMGYKLRYVTVICLAAITLAACSASTPEEHVQRALGYRAKGQLNAAVIELKNALQQDPKLGEARLELGELYLQLARSDDALNELDRALNLGMPKGRVMPPLLEAKVDLGRTQDVLGALESLPMTPRLQCIRGEARFLTGDTAAGRADLEAALAKDPALPRAYLALAQMALTGPAPDAAGAAAILTKGTTAVPSDWRLWLALAELDLRQRNFAEAETAFEKAKSIPGSGTRPELGLARLRIAQGNVADAEAIVDRILAREPKLRMALHLKAVIAVYNGDLDTAERTLQTVLSAWPDYAPSVLALAHVKHAQGQLNEAQSLLRRYLSLDPSGGASAPARKALAVMLIEQSRPADAVEVLKPIASELTDGKDIALMGIANLRAGNLEEASRYLEAAAAALPDTPELQSRLAVDLAAAGDDVGALARLNDVVPSGALATQNEILKVYLNLRRGNGDAALDAANRLVASGSDQALAQNVLGVVQLTRKNYIAARTAFEAALATNPKFGTAAVNLARLDLTEGKSTDARKHLESALAANPSDQEVLNELAQILLDAGEIDKATEYLQRARQNDANAIGPRITLARLAQAAGDLETADAMSAEAEAIDANLLDVWLIRAQVKAAKGQKGDLNRYLDKLQAALGRMQQPKPAIALQVGELQRQAGRLDAGRSNLKIALKVPKFEVPALVALVQLETNANELDQARYYLDRLEKAGTDKVVIAELEGDLAAATGQVDAAESQYAKAANSRGAVTKLARLYERQGKPAAGVAILEKWVDAHPKDDGVALILAGMRVSAGDTVHARKDYEALLGRSGDDPMLLNNLAWLYFEAKDPRAEETARKAHALAPGNPYVNDTLGWILVNDGAGHGASEGLELLERSAAQRETPDVLFHLAVAQQRVGRTRDARQTVAQALKTKQFPERAAAEQLAKSLEEGS